MLLLEGFESKFMNKHNLIVFIHHENFFQIQKKTYIFLKVLVKDNKKIIQPNKTFKNSFLEGITENRHWGGPFSKN